MLEYITIAAIILVAAGFTGWRAWQTLRVASGSKACGGCDKKCD